MGDLEAIECCLEAISIRAGSHHSHHYRSIVLQPAVPHHRIFLIIERIEYLDSIKPAHSLDPDIFYRLIQLDDTPVTGLMGHDRTEIVLSVDKFNFR